MTLLLALAIAISPIPTIKSPDLPNTGVSRYTRTVVPIGKLDWRVRRPGIRKSSHVRIWYAGPHIIYWETLDGEIVFHLWNPANEPITIHLVSQ